MEANTQYNEIKRFENDLGKCMKCGFCTFYCPVYQEERTEPSVARGKNMMLRGLLDGSLEYSKDFINRLNKCTLCMTCTTNCPVKANIPNVIVAGRADKVNIKGTGFPYNIIYKYLLTRRILFGSILRFASLFQGIFLPKTKGTIRHLPMFLSALGKGRHIPQISPKFLRQIIPVVNKPPSHIETKLRVGYFTGCMTEYVFPEVGKKIIDFLTKHGVEVVVPLKQSCCGAPVFLGGGDFETGRLFADNNVKTFEEFDYVITDCATCSSAMKDYTKFLADTPERRELYSGFSNKVKDIIQFLVDVLKLPASAYKATLKVRGRKVTWHDPCHLNRHMGIKEQPRQILQAMSDIDYVEMPDAERCCGMAGAFSIQFYDLSKKIADRKVESIDTSGAEIVVTGCPGCQIQLTDSLLRNGKRLEVMHLMELLD